MDSVQPGAIMHVPFISINKYGTFGLVPVAPKFHKKNGLYIVGAAGSVAEVKTAATAARLVFIIAGIGVTAVPVVAAAFGSVETNKKTDSVAPTTTALAVIAASNLINDKR
jgi:hypothetical protein